MSVHRDLEALWTSGPRGGGAFAPAGPERAPEAARRYFAHAIAPGTPLAAAVRLRMHGEIRLRRWFPFRAEQVIRLGRGMIWAARVRMHGLPVLGFDRLLDGSAQMRWKLFGLVPLVSASGPDIARSAAGRVAAESAWLPTMLLGEDVAWSAKSDTGALARFVVQGHEVALELGIGGNGGLLSLKLSRWGNPEGGAFHEADFGAVVEEERSFGGYTIPTRLRVGWHFGSARFEAEGEFFRVSVDEAMFR